MACRRWWSVGVVLLVGCAAESTSTSGPTTTTQSPGASPTSLVTTINPATTLAVTSYVVQAGDALYLIAQQHCVTVDEIVAANMWSDGLDHALFPGDSIALPARSCSFDSTTAPDAGDVGEPISKEDALRELGDPVAQLRAIRFAFDGTSGTNAGQFSDPACVLAYAVGLDFELGVGSRAETLAALGALGEPLPSYLADYIDAWDDFLSAHGEDALRILSTEKSEGEQAALADRALEEVSYAVVNVMHDHGRRRVSEFVNGDRCSPFQL